jgi:hypothetical protein
MAVYLTAGMFVWGLFEFTRDCENRARYGVLATTAAACAMVILVLVSLPYLGRPEAQGELELVVSRWQTSQLEPGPGLGGFTLTLLLSTYVGVLLKGGQGVPLEWMPIAFRSAWATGSLTPFGVLTPLVIIVALVTALRRQSSIRRWVACGAAMVLVTVLLLGPEHLLVAGINVPLPRALLAATPARFIRVPIRAVVVGFFGGALLVACGLDVVMRWLTRRTRIVLASVLVVSTAIWVPPGWPLSSAGICVWPQTRFTPVEYVSNSAVGRDANSYAMVAATLRQAGPGPLLDMPPTSDGTAVVGQSIHRQPSVSFYTGYVPAHVSLVDNLISRLPDPSSLDDLVDVTGLRWILLRPPDEWIQPSAYRSMLNGLAHHPRTKSVRTVGLFKLIELNPTSRHPDWMRAVAAGPRRGYSALGTPLVPLDGASVGSYELHLPMAATAGAWTGGEVVAVNEGPHAWPAAVPAHPRGPLTIGLDLRWLDPAGDAVASQHVDLRRDVPAGERFVQSFVATAPERPGHYRVEVALRQADGADLASPQNPAYAEIDVRPSAR